MATRLLYQEDPDVVTCPATIQSVAPYDAAHFDIRLDKTCFYPRTDTRQGDTGTIKSFDGKVTFVVREVLLDKAGVMHHIGTFADGQLQAGDEVVCTVDAERRKPKT